MLPRRALPPPRFWAGLCGLLVVCLALLLAVRSATQPVEPPPEIDVVVAPPPETAPQPEPDPPPRHLTKGGGGPTEPLPPDEDATEPTSPVISWYEALPSTDFVYAVPPFELGEPAEVVLAISPGLDGAEQVEVLVTERGVDEADTHSSKTRFSQTMDAMLGSTASVRDLEIVARTQERQPVAHGLTTTWSWVVTPHSPGTYELELSLYAVYEQGASKSIRSWRRDIVVEATGWRTVQDLIGTHWEWVWTLLIPALALAWRKRHRFLPSREEA